MRLLITGFLLFASLPIVVAAESPREFVHRFYTAYRDWSFRGVPFRDQERLISPYCGMEIIRIFRRVNDQRDLEEEMFPTDPDNPQKPSWSAEGQVFCDVYEGITYFSVGRQGVENGRISVAVHLELIEQGKSYPWPDRVILDRAGSNWVIYDIQYSGGGSLLKSIEQELTQNAKQLNQAPQEQETKKANKSEMATPRKPSD